LAHSISARKRARQNVKRRAYNRSHKSALRKQVGKALEAFSGGDRGKAEEQLRAATRALDQSAARGVIHRNAAARKKSRLARRMSALGKKAAKA
jgi:small subunit ribosomal protein S20